MTHSVLADCDHESYTDMGDGALKCNGCPAVFLYCMGCSSEEGAVYHTPPMCARRLTSGASAPKGPLKDSAVSEEL